MSESYRLNTNPTSLDHLLRNAQRFGDPIIDEIPGGDIDGVNLIFTLANPPREGSLKLYADGLRVLAADYTTAITAGVFTITLTTAPATSLVADYRA